MIDDSNSAEQPATGRKFETGAYRDSADDKLDFEGFLSPVVLQRYAEYMHKNRKQTNGELRDSDNWQQGIPKDVYMKSMWRHFFSVWTAHREGGEVEEDLCALAFNVMGYLFEELKDKHDPSKRLMTYEDLCGERTLRAPWKNNAAGLPATPSDAVGV